MPERKSDEAHSRAVVLENYGEPADVLQVRDMPVPNPERGEVRVRMLACPINPSDLMMVRGHYGIRPTLPATPGLEGVGVVEANGGGLLGKYLVGKRVAVLNSRLGNWREQTIVSARQAIPLPADLPWEQAAMFFVNPATAYIMTRKVLGVRRKGWLLQTAAGSALGRMVIRLGRKFDFRTISIVRREEQAEELKTLGADAVLTFDPQRHEAAQLLDEIRRITDGRGVPYAIEPVGGPTGSAVISALADRGRMLVYGTLSDQPLSFSPRELLTREARIEGFWLARWMDRQPLLGKIRLIRAMTQLMRQQVLVSDVGRSFPLEEIREAVREAETVGRRGKVLLRIGE